MYLYLIYVPLGPRHSALIINRHVAAVFAAVNIYACTCVDGAEQVKVQTQPMDGFRDAPISVRPEWNNNIEMQITI